MPTRVEQLLADPDFRSLPAANREPLLVDAIAADAAPTYERPQRVGEPRPGTAAEREAAQTPLPPQVYTPTDTGEMALSPRNDQPNTLEPGLQESFTDPKTMALMAAGGAAGGLGGTLASRALTGASPWVANVGTALGTGAGFEAVNLADKATQPGATVGSVLTPDLSDALSVLGPLALTTIMHPHQMVIRPLARALASSSEVGKKAALEATQAPVIAANTAEQGRFDAVSQASKQRMAGQETALMADQGAINTANRALQADFDNTMAVKANSKAIADARHASDVESWQAVMDQQAANKEAYTNAVTNLQMTLTEQRSASNRLPLIQKKANVGEAATFAENAIPVPPTKAQVEQAFKAVDELAATNLTPDGKVITYRVPELQAVQGNLGKTADMLEKFPGTERFVGWLRARATNPESLTLSDIQTYQTYLNDEMSNLRGPTTRNFAAQESRHVQQTLEALDKGLEALAGAEGVPNQFRMLLLNARTMYRESQTSQELTQFVTHDVLTRTTGGEQILNPVRALQALDSPRYRSMRFYMEKQDMGNGQNLYESTKQLFTEMAQQGMSRRDMLNLHAMQTGEALGSEYQALPAGHPALQLPAAPPQPVPAPFSPTGLTPQPNLTPVPEAAPVPPSGFRPEPNLTPVPQGDTRPGGLALTAHYGSGLAAGGAALLAGANPYVAGSLGVFTQGFATYVAALLRTTKGQATLATLIQENGKTVTPVLEGFLKASTVGLLPKDAPIPKP